tara:strand:+ start:2752 stop:3654 length:903 start_codon:yes stop_codon:yes gene_type:complete
MDPQDVLPLVGPFDENIEALVDLYYLNKGKGKFGKGKGKGKGQWNQWINNWMGMNPPQLPYLPVRELDPFTDLYRDDFLDYLKGAFVAVDPNHSGINNKIHMVHISAVNVREKMLTLRPYTKIGDHPAAPFHRPLYNIPENQISVYEFMHMLDNERKYNIMGDFLKYVRGHSPRIERRLRRRAPKEPPLWGSDNSLYDMYAEIFSRPTFLEYLRNTFIAIYDLKPPIDCFNVSSIIRRNDKRKVELRAYRKINYTLFLPLDVKEGKEDIYWFMDKISNSTKRTIIGDFLNWVPPIEISDT